MFHVVYKRVVKTRSIKIVIRAVHGTGRRPEVWGHSSTWAITSSCSCVQSLDLSLCFIGGGILCCYELDRVVSRLVSFPLGDRLKSRQQRALGIFERGTSGGSRKAKRVPVFVKWCQVNTARLRENLRSVVRSYQAWGRCFRQQADFRCRGNELEPTFISAATPRLVMFTHCIRLLDKVDFF